MVVFPQAPRASTSIQNLDFTVSAPGLTVNDFIANAKNLVFAVDVNQCSIVCTGKGATVISTGNVGAYGGVGGVPEPATWAMMLTGLFGLGGLLRRRRMLAPAETSQLFRRGPTLESAVPARSGRRSSSGTIRSWLRREWLDGA